MSQCCEFSARIEKITVNFCLLASLINWGREFSVHSTSVLNIGVTVSLLWVKRAEVVGSICIYITMCM